MPLTGWSLTGCTAEKDTTNFESGAYGLRLNQTGTIETYAATTLPAALVKRLRGKTVVLAARVFVPSTSTRGNCGSIQIPEITNNRPYGTPSGGVEAYLESNCYYRTYNGNSPYGTGSS